MSHLLDPLQPAYLNDGMEDLFHSEDENEHYTFTYVPASQFRYIVKDVRRQRCKEEEDSIWNSFVKQQELNSLTYEKNGIQPSTQNIKELLNENMKEANKELERLEADVLPNGVRRKCNKLRISQKKRSKINNIKDLSLREVPIMKDNGTGSTNLLLTIPEEKNACVYQKQEFEDFKLNTRKSCSSHVIAQKKQYSKQPLHITNGVEYSTSPENSTCPDNVTDGVIYIRPDPFTMHKILTMQKKVGELLDEIAFRLGKIPIPDGVKDLQKRQQCVAEFTIRFSRNYLYDLNRYVKDIQRHMYIISPRARIRPNHRSLGLHMHAIEHKLLAAHQLLLHALIAYCKHIPSSILKGHPGKFREILQIVIDLKTMCDRLQLNTNYLDFGDNDILSLGKDIESKCNAILSKLKLHSDNDPLFNGNKTSSMASFIPYSTENKNCFNKKQLSNRLSMYSIDTKVTRNNPKHRTNCYHRKKKRYNTMNIKEASNESIQDQRYPSPITIRSSKDANQVIVTKDRIHVKEENIKTVMNMLPIDSDNCSNTEIREIPENNVILTRKKSETLAKSANKPHVSKQSETMEKIVKNACTNNDDELMKKVTMITEEHLSNLVPIIADLISLMSMKRNESETRTTSILSAETLMEFLQKHQLSEVTNTKISANTNHVFQSSTENNCKREPLKTSRITNETRRSEKNMQLICMSSIENSLEIPRCRELPCHVNRESLMELTDFEAKVREGKGIRDSLNNIELIISEETELNFLKYKREYQRLMQSIPMYCSNTQNKPWDIVAWISDKLVEELITEIAKELQMDHVIQKLFELEFQEF